jgi:hypothetical protein
VRVVVRSSLWSASCRSFVEVDRKGGRCCGLWVGGLVGWWVGGLMCIRFRSSVTGHLVYL